MTNQDKKLYTNMRQMKVNSFIDSVIELSKIENYENNFRQKYTRRIDKTN